MRLRRFGIGLIVVALAWGCGGPPADGGNGGVSGYMTPAEAAEHVQALENDAVAIGNGLIDGVLGNLLAGIPSLADGNASLPLLELAPVWGLAPRMQRPGETFWRVPVGIWTHDATTGQWGYEPGPTGAMSVRWVAQTGAATANELLLTWMMTTTITLPGGETWAAPTSAAVEVFEGTRKIVDLTLSQTWRPTVCGAHEASRLAIAGTAGDGAAGVTFRDLAIAATATGWALTGGADLRAGSLTVAVDLDTTVTGSVVRDATDCALADLDLEGFGVGASVVTPARNARLTGQVGLTEVSGGMQVQVTTGRFTVGNRRVDFAGTVPPDTQNPAAAIAMTFAGGEVLTLQQFVDQFGLFD